MITPSLIGLEGPLFSYFIRHVADLQPEQLEACLKQQEQAGGRLSELFRSRGLLTREQLRKVFEQQGEWVATALSGDLPNSSFPLDTSLTVCMPVYNEADYIEDTLDAALSVLPHFVKHLDIMVVDDGSEDGTADIVERYRRTDARVRLVRIEQHKGHKVAVSTGLRNAKGEVIFFPDTEGQFSILDIPPFLTRLLGCKEVSGWLPGEQFIASKLLYLPHRRSAVSRGVKRAIDLVSAAVLLLVLSPLLLVVALLIKLTDGGPALFWQIRVGRWGKEFLFPKFRSMVVNAEKLQEQLLTRNDHKESVTFKMKNDPRITWIGRIIRRWSIDELPQLWLVLTGQMSLVGPRPALPHEVAQYALTELRRLGAVPGLTCIWQVRGRGSIPFAKQVELDIQYVENQSLWLEFKLLLQTIPVVLSGKGAF